jgi:hypothetical protein
VDGRNRAAGRPKRADVRSRQPPIEGCEKNLLTWRIFGIFRSLDLMEAQLKKATERIEEAKA